MRSKREVERKCLEKGKKEKKKRKRVLLVNHLLLPYLCKRVK